MIKFDMSWDLGIKRLIPQWKALFTTKELKDDVFAGMSVALVAIPLSLAIALASGVDPAIGLLTAIVASVVAALFGGTPLAVTGPAAAMSVLIAQVVYDFGFKGLLVVTMICGLLQLLSGIFGLGRFIRHMPYPVLAGFTAGIGAIILIGQTSRVFGLPTPENSYISSVIAHIWNNTHNINFAAVTFSLSTLAIIFILPKFLKRFPVILIAVIVPTLVARLLHVTLPTIGNIPDFLPLPHMPAMPEGNLWDLVETGFVVYLLASVETLLSSSAVDKISRSKPHDSNQELIGQGLGNITAAFFGGIPVTGVIARSALNVQSGGKTRRAAIFHALFLLLLIFLFNKQIADIPIAVLAGVLVSVALRMLNPAELMMLWRTDKTEGLIFLTTFFCIVCFDLIYGIKIGILIAMLVALFRLSRTSASIRQPLAVGPAVVTMRGPITFVSADKLDNIYKKILRKDLSRGLIIDFSEVHFVDSSGVSQLLGYLHQLTDLKVKLALKNVTPELSEIINMLDEDKIFQKHMIYDDKELKDFFPDSKIYSMVKLVDGAHHFKTESKRTRKEQLSELAKAQTPHTLLIACADSRIDTLLMTNSDLGEIFTLRNVGNVIPAYGTDDTPAEGAGIEYALGVLKVDHIIVCGHSNCGAITAIMQQTSLDAYPNLKSWLAVASTVREKLPDNASVEDAIKLNILMQIENIKTYPLVREKLQTDQVHIHGWFYDVATGESKEWNEEKQNFVAIGTGFSRMLLNAKLDEKY